MADAEPHPRRGAAALRRSDPEEEEAIVELASRFRFVITPYFASLMDPQSPHCPIPSRSCRARRAGRRGGLADPLDEVAHSPVKNVVGVYPDRIAFCVNNECALYCRYCLRKRMVGDSEWAMQKKELEVALDWIAATPEIRDVLLTGGDPLVFSDARLEWLLTRLRAIPHVELIRLGTRLPVTLPFRVTDELCAMLERFHPLWVNTHFNHPRELTADAAAACDRLLRAGIPVGNQSVLLQGVNDDHDIMKALCETLSACASLLRLPGAAPRRYRAFSRADRGRGRALQADARPHERLRDSAVRARHAPRQGAARSPLREGARWRRLRGRGLGRRDLARAEPPVAPLSAGERGEGRVTGAGRRPGRSA